MIRPNPVFILNYFCAILNLANGLGYDSFSNKLIKTQFLFETTNVEQKLSCLNQCTNYSHRKCNFVGVRKTNDNTFICQFSAIPRALLMAYSQRYVEDSNDAEIYYPSLETNPNGWILPIAYYPLDSITNGSNILLNMENKKVFDQVQFYSKPVYTCIFQLAGTYLKTTNSLEMVDHQIIFNNTLNMDFNTGFSISLRFNPQSRSSFGGLLYSYDSSSAYVLGVWIWGTAYQGIAIDMSGVGTFTFNSPAFNRFAVDQWHHMIVAFNGTHCTLYGNGSWIMSSNWNLKKPNWTYGQYARIGRNMNSQFDGCIGHLAYFKSYLSLEEATFIYNFIT
jgi:hypothetical protein